jgi:hypothetical protein
MMGQFIDYPVSTTSQSGASARSRLVREMRHAESACQSDKKARANGKPNSLTRVSLPRLVPERSANSSEGLCLALGRAGFGLFKPAFDVPSQGVQHGAIFWTVWRSEVNSNYRYRLSTLIRQP